VVGAASASYKFKEMIEKPYFLEIMDQDHFQWVISWDYKFKEMMVEILEQDHFQRVISWDYKFIQI
jgi:hypothetical protein